MASKQGLNKVLKLYKNSGETPLECILKFKKNNPKFEKIKMTYAGRLDPLAFGLLLVLTGDECKNKDKYLKLDKVYDLDILFGFSTDTYDLLGLVKKNKNYNQIDLKEIDKILKNKVGKFLQKYPPYSSKTLNGKKLFSLAKKGVLNDEDIPEKEVTIKKITKIKNYYISKEKLEKDIIKSISSVSGDFRQNKILKTWKGNLLRSKNIKYKVVSVRVSCTSGTYMRSLADSIGNLVKIPSLAFKIKRISVGKYKI
jgi:tRNA pseudouridine55 synthase